MISRRINNNQTERRRRSSGNYYRSGARSSTKTSPFQAAEKPGRVTGFFTKLIDISLLILILIGLVYSLLVSNNPVIQVSSTAYNSAQNYHDTAKRFLGAFKNRNKITFDDQSVVNRLEQDYPEIDYASIELPFFGERPVIHIHISAPSFVLSESDGQSYLVDSQGKAIGYAVNFKSSAGLPRITDQTKYRVTNGKAVLGAPEVAFIKSLLAESSHAGVKFSKLVLPNEAEELDAYPAGEPYYVKFNLGGDSPTQIGQFLASKHNFDSSGQKPTSYLDVRVAGKIFYK